MCSSVVRETEKLLKAMVRRAYCLRARGTEGNRSPQPLTSSLAKLEGKDMRSVGVSLPPVNLEIHKDSSKSYNSTSPSTSLAPLPVLQTGSPPITIDDGSTVTSCPQH